MTNYIQEAQKLNDVERREFLREYVALKNQYLGEYIVVGEGGRCRICHVKNDEMSWPLEEARKFLVSNVFITRLEYKANSANNGMSSKEVRKGLFDLWFYSSKTKRYHKIVYRPGDKRKTIREGRFLFYNRWCDFPYRYDVHHYPKTASCSLYLELIEEIICNSNNKAYEYVLDWIADIFQHPEKKNGIALAIYSEKMGNGKTTFVEMLGKMLDPYYVKIGSATLQDRFNSIMRNRLLIFTDENQFYTGREVWNKLKDLITSDSIIIEEKGINKITTEHYGRFIFAANEKRSVALETDNRRYVPLHCAERKLPAGDYEKLRKQMEDGGYGVFTDMMLNRKITHKWRPIPIFDDAYLDNRLSTLEFEDPAVYWAYLWLIAHDLENKVNPFVEQHKRLEGKKWDGKIYNDVMWECFNNWSDDSNLSKHKTITSMAFHESMKKIIDPMFRGRDDKGRYTLFSENNIEDVKHRISIRIFGSEDGVYFADEEVAKNEEEDKEDDPTVPDTIPQFNVVSNKLNITVQVPSIGPKDPEFQKLAEEERLLQADLESERGDILQEFWNPIIGCERYSEGCAHCWWIDRRLPQLAEKYKKFRNIDPHKPYRMMGRISIEEMERKNGIIGICQHGDLFWDKIEDETIHEVIDAIERKGKDRNRYVLWTKRAERMANIIQSRGSIKKRIVCAVSAENQKRLDERLLHLVTIPTTKILVLEPLLEEVVIGPLLEQVDWVIVGSETGESARPMNLDWVRKIRDEVAGKVPFFIKQLGTSHKDQVRELDGKVWNERPKAMTGV